MKKLVIALLAMLAVGCSLFTIGRIAGGKIYGSYDNGRLYSFEDTFDDWSDRFEDRFDHWSDRFEDRFDNWSDRLEDRMEADWMENELDDLKDALDDLEDLDETAVQELDFHLSGGTFRIEAGERFSFFSDDNPYPSSRSDIDDQRWLLTLYFPPDAETVITLPYGAVFSQVSLSAQAKEINVETDLSAVELDITLSGNTDFKGDFLDTQDGDLQLEDGSFRALLAGAEQEYRYQAKITGTGCINWNGKTITRRETGSGFRKLEICADSGRFDLETEY